MDFEYTDISKMIDHALLVPATTVAELQSGIAMARAFDVASVCIMPYYLRQCADALAGSTVLPSTVIGFPHGGQVTSTKVAEAKRAVADGGVELDMVVNISKVLSEDWGYVQAEIREIVDVAHAEQRKVKVIFENCYLEDKHKIRLCEISSEVGADWVKTSTGYGTSGATVDDLKLMRASAAAEVQVKAAGGVRDMAKVLEVRGIGVTRIGTSGTAKMLNECRQLLGLDPINAVVAPKTDY